MSESEFNDYNEVIYERDKLKDQNEKLKAALEVLKSSIEFTETEEGSQCDKDIISETLKSCES